MALVLIKQEYMNFEPFNFHPSIMAGVRALGYSAPTPIQSQAIPPIMQGRDVIGLARTDTSWVEKSGEALAFVISADGGEIHTLEQLLETLPKCLTL